MISRILFVNFFKSFSLEIVLVLISISGIIFFFDIIELSKASFSFNTSVIFLVKMALMKNYKSLEKIIPFVILIASILFFNKKSRNLEIIAAKSAGMSSFSLLAPILMVTILFATLNITILNPIGVYFLKRYQDIEAIKLKGQKSLVMVSKSGIWLRKKVNGDVMIINALRVSQNSQALYDINIFCIYKEANFSKRIIADRGIFKENLLELYNVEILDQNLSTQHKNKLTLPIKITLSEIIESLSSPETISFWSLPEYIDIAKSSGLSSKIYIYYLLKSISSPFFLISMIFLSYAFITRFKNHNVLNLSIFFTIIVGIVLYFLANFIYALGLSDKLPMIFSVILPIIISNAITLFSLLHVEL